MITFKDILWGLDPRVWFNNARWSLVDWLDGGRFHQAIHQFETASARLRRLQADHHDLRQRIADAQAGVVPGPHRPRGSLPDATFVGIHDYGKGVTREEALTFQAIRVPGSGMTVRVEEGQLVVRDRMGELLSAITNRDMSKLI